MRGLLLLLYLFPTYLCLRMVSLEIPESVLIGDPVWLICDYDLEGKELEEVKWYKDKQLIYRFLNPILVPTNEYLGLTYHIVDQPPGVFAKWGLSNETHLFLWRSNLYTEGSYSCAVSVLGSLQVVQMEKIMRVQVIPSEPPRIYIPSKEYKMGDLVNMTCVYGPSKHLSRMIWYINYEEAPRSSVFPLNTTPGTASPTLPTESLLSFVLGPQVRLVTCAVSQEPLDATLDVLFRATDGRVIMSLLPGSSRHIPIIARYPERYNTGDNVDMDCFAGSYRDQRLKLEWTINDEVVPPEYLSWEQSSSFIGFSLVLRFIPTADHWRSGKMSVKCTALYTDKGVETSVHFPLDPRTLTDSGISVASQVH